MIPDTMLPLIGFALVTSLTPGPNNIMLMTSGANFGFRRTVPHMLGVGIGFTAMIVLVGLGLAGVFERFPVAYTAMKAASVIYMVWLAWKIGHAAAPSGATGVRATGRPITFLQAAIFQWVNPKAWAMALSAVTLYAPDRSLASILIVAALFGAINLPSVSSWTVLGTALRHWLSDPRRLRVFNWAMAALLIASLLPVLMA